MTVTDLGSPSGPRSPPGSAPPSREAALASFDASARRKLGGGRDFFIGLGSVARAELVVMLLHEPCQGLSPHLLSLVRDGETLRLEGGGGLGGHEELQEIARLRLCP